MEAKVFSAVSYSFLANEIQKYYDRGFVIEHIIQDRSKTTSEVIVVMVKHENK